MIKVRGSLPTLFPSCQRGKEKMVLPSMPKGEIVGNMALHVGIHVNTMKRLALHDYDNNTNVRRLLAIIGWP